MALRFSSCFGEPRIRVGSIVHERLLCMRWLRVSATRRPMVNTGTPCGQDILFSHCTCGVVFMPRLGFQQWTFSDESVRVAFGTTGCLSWVTGSNFSVAPDRRPLAVWDKAERLRLGGGR